ncbi:type VI secretion system-associated FHA domain protein TagH [Salmonella enterica]
MAEEKQQSRQTSLTLQVMNGNELESGRAAKCQFTEDGGNIGHADDCRWPVQDRAGAIAGRACAVVRHDGAFCLKSLMPGVMINQAPASSDTLVRLRQGDEIQLGALALKVFLHEGAAITYDERMATPETIVMNRDSLAETLLTTEGQPEYPGMPFRHQMGQTVAHGFSSDPLQALQSESLTAATDYPFSMRASRADPPLSDLTGSHGINTPFMDLPPGNNRDDNDDDVATMTQYHLAVTPLLRGMDCPLTINNSQDADDFLEEAGRALQAAIRGLLNLQQQQNSLSDKHLRPLEDNPLRLDMDYATALNVMFAEGKSPVHLAAPAAISESLRNIRHHEEANQAAIREALRVMLDAFSPASLMKRFVQYRRSHEQRQPLNDAGAWQMYSHYYDELASSRQQGFEMLFNEVYAQVYDRVLREKQREPEA